MMIIQKAQDLGAEVRKARREQGLTQIELAGLAGIGTRFLGELERGKESCELGKTLHVLKMLGLRWQIEAQSDD